MERRAGSAVKQAPTNASMLARILATTFERSSQNLRPSVLGRAQSDETAQILNAETSQTHELSIFGGPYFVVGRELF
jgi:hypothetical protein